MKTIYKYFSLIFLVSTLLVLAGCNASGSEIKTIKYKNQNIIDLANKMEELGTINDPFASESNKNGSDSKDKKSKLNGLYYDFESYNAELNSDTDITEQPKIECFDYETRNFFDEINSTYDRAVSEKTAILNSTSYVNKWDHDIFDDSETTSKVGNRISYDANNNSVNLERYYTLNIKSTNKYSGNYTKVYVDEKLDKKHYTFYYVEWSDLYHGVNNSVTELDYIDYKEDDYCMEYKQMFRTSYAVNSKNEQVPYYMLTEFIEYVDLKGETPIYYYYSIPKYYDENMVLTYDGTNEPYLEIFWLDDNMYNHWDNKIYYYNYFISTYKSLRDEGDDIDICLYRLNGIKKILVNDMDEHGVNEFTIEFENGKTENIKTSEIDYNCKTIYFDISHKDDLLYPYVHFPTLNKDDIKSFLDYYGLTVDDSIENYMDAYSLDYVFYFTDMTTQEIWDWLVSLMELHHNSFDVDNVSELMKDFENVDEIFTLISYDMEYRLGGKLVIKDNKIDVREIDIEVVSLKYTICNEPKDVKYSYVIISINGIEVRSYSVEENEMKFVSDEYIIDLKDYNFNYSDLKITLLINGNAAIELPSDFIQIDN